MRRGAAQVPAGSVIVITGSMFSGKTEELIRRVERAERAKRRIQCFKPRIDDRYDDAAIVSHGSRRTEAVAVSTSSAILERVADEVEVVAIDEAQFFDRGIVDVSDELANRGISVLLSGLDQDYRGRPFFPMPELMAIADEVIKVHAVCAVCGERALRSQRLLPEAGTVFVGGSESYEPRCRACFDQQDE